MLEVVLLVNGVLQTFLLVLRLPCAPFFTLAGFAVFKVLVQNYAFFSSAFFSGIGNGSFPAVVTLRLTCDIFGCTVFPQTVFLILIPFAFFLNPTASTASIFLRAIPSMSFRIGKPQ